MEVWYIIGGIYLGVILIGFIVCTHLGMSSCNAWVYLEDKLRGKIRQIKGEVGLWKPLILLIPSFFSRRVEKRMIEMMEEVGLEVEKNS